MKIRPLADRIVVKRTQKEEKTKGGIIIPDTAKEKPVEGLVVAVGNGKALKDGKVRPLDVKAGDRVLFGKYSGTEVKLDGVEHVHPARGRPPRGARREPPSHPDPQAEERHHHERKADRLQPRRPQRHPPRRQHPRRTP